MPFARATGSAHHTRFPATPNAAIEPAAVRDVPLLSFSHELLISLLELLPCLADGSALTPEVLFTTVNAAPLSIVMARARHSLVFIVFMHSQ